MEPTYIALDLETTGLEPGRDEIIEIGAVKFRGSEVLETYQTLVKPRQVLPVKISRLTGIEASELVDAPLFNAIGPDLVRFLKSYPIVGHSIGGDLRFLAAQNLRISQPSYDTFDLATLLVPQLPSYSLSALAEHLQIAHPDAHRALADADVSRQVFIGLLDKMAALSVGELHEIAEMTAKLNWPTAKLFGELAKKRVKTLWEAPISFKPKPAERPPALEPTGDVTPLDVAAVGAFFGPDGTLSRYFAGYEPRQQQAEMAQAVTAALNDGDTLMVEAGTGTGKCLVGDTWITFQSGHRQQIAAICHAEAPPTEPIVSITPAGKLIYQRIQATYCNGIRPVFRVRTALGRTVTATANHPLLRFDGWQNLSDLQVGDQIATVRDSAELVEDAPSDLAWDRIVAIEPAGEAETFDLTIEGEPNFIANDLVVHNSMAYLVPAAEFARQRGERVVISTNTINLQDQLCSKDIPALQAILDTQEPDLPPLRAVQLKGRGNYLCLKRYEDVRARKDHTDDETRALVKIQLWLPSTTTGDRSELMLMQNENSAWGSVNVNPDMCLRQRCPLYDQCYFYKARAEAENAHVVVVNHALLLSDVKSPGILPRYDHLIIDEAHNLEDVATDQLGFAIAQSEFMAILDDLHVTGGPRLVQGLLAEWPVQFKLSTVPPRDRQKLEDLSDGLRPNVDRGREAAQALFQGFNATMQHDRSVTQYDARLRLTAKSRKQAGWADVEQAWENLSFNLRALADGLEKFQVLLEGLENRDIADYDGLLMRVKGLAKLCQNVQQQLDLVVYGNEETVAWLTADQRRNELIVQAAPINVGPLLVDELWSKKRAVVLASATLSVNRSFAYPKARLGLDEATELQLDSPFDYAKSTLLYLPTDMPEPNEKSYQRALEDALITLCRATGGRTLALFTANHALRQTYHGISEALEKDEITTMAQGLDGSRRSLIQRFKSDPRTVLLGTSSFWEGVDVVGDALSVLVITKLPFSVPNDPVFSARSEGFTDAFGEYSVPQAILRFKQGFGRLIRSKEDRGIVLVLDRRLLSKGYGRTFINSLPECTVVKKPLADLAATAARWLV